MKICVMTLGCKVNKYESDALLYNLKIKGYDVSDSLGFADVYVINSCAVTQEAEKKSRQMVARCRKFNPQAKIFVCGCASQHNSRQFIDKNVDYVCGAAGKIKISDYIDKLSKNDKRLLRKRERIDKIPFRYEDDLLAMQTRTRAYIKIQDGCNNFCSYCIIPYLRGRSRSRAIFSIINEVSELGDNIKEIVLTGINVTDYKIDGQPALLTLIEELDTFGKRLRLSSMEESLVTEDFVCGLSKLKNFCPHFHLSLQSGCDIVLKRMNRHYTAAEFARSVNLIRKYFPLAGITTDIIVGFPDETDEKFEKTVNFVKEVGFSQLHIFQYSKRDGTAAAKLYKDLPPQIKQSRFEKLCKLNDELKRNFIKKNKIGNVLFEECADGYLVGYSKNYIRCYLKATENDSRHIEDFIDHELEVKIHSPFKDGALVTIRRSAKNMQ